MEPCANNQQQSSFKCRKCRHFLFNEDSVLHSTFTQESDLTTTHHQSSGTGGALWYISEDASPSWIKTAVEESHWTRGKLACPKCRGRLGSFDFLVPSKRHHQDHQGPWSSIHIISSRVDRELPKSQLAKLRGGIREQDLQVKDHVSSAESKHNFKMGVVNLLPNEDGALPKGSWYLDTHELDSRLCKVSEVESIAVDESVSFALLPTSRSTSLSSTEPKVGNQLRFRPGHKNTKHSKTRSYASNANPAQETQSNNIKSSRQTNPGTSFRDSSAEQTVSLSVDDQSTLDVDSELEMANEVPTHVVVGTSSSSLTWQDFLDELLFELERETSEGESSTLRAENDVNQLVDDVDTDSQQEASASSDNDFQVNGTQDTEGTSAYLQRAILSAQKKEKNRRKNERRKLRRRERWQEEKTMKDHELLMEEQILDCDSTKIMSLLSVRESGMSLREATTCPVCLDLYLYPNVCIPCQHIFCEPCLRQLAQAVQSSTTPCPLCRTVIQRVKAHETLTTAIQDAFPRMIALRKQNERKTLNKSYPLPGDAALNTPMSTWFNHMLRGHTRRHNAMGLHHSRWRGRQEVGMAWQIGAACILMTALVGLTGVFLFSMMLYS